MTARILLVFALNTVIATTPLLCQTSSPPAADTDRAVIHTSTREVLLDLVARDKHHHPVTDLRPEEVEIYEDGVRQNIRVFRNIQGRDELANERDDPGTQKPALPAKSGETPHPLNTMRQVNFVSVVFAQVAPLNLEFARRALQEFLKSDNLPNTYVTIYRLDRTLQLLQPYTIDKDAMAKAVDVATKGLRGGGQLDVSSEVASSALATLNATAENILASPSTGPTTAAAVQNLLLNPLPAIAHDPLFAANAASQDASVQLGNALLVQAALAKGLRFATSLSDGMDAMDSLHELVRSEELLPGRKVVLYLADGLTFPTNRRDAVDNLISYANRSGVSFYTIDTRGLNVEDPMMQALAAQRRTGAESVAQKVDPMNGHLEDDDVQLTAVASAQLAMRELAESTGGFAVTNTNEISLPMQHMMEDIRSHYELAYAPTSTNYDGHFRKIDVKISRPKITLQTRKGYYAVPDLNGEPLQPFELLALNAMNTPHADQGFPYQVSAMKFRPQENAVEYELTFEVPLSGIKAITDKKTGDLSFRAALVAFIHDSTGEIVRKVSRELARKVSAGDVAQMQADRILYAEPVDLQPGHYVIDTAVTDEQTGRTSAKRVSVFVDPGKNLSLSSLGLVRRFEPLTGPRNLLSPFDLENGRVTPTLVDSVASGNPLSLYFVVYPTKATTAEETKLTVQLMRDGREIARKPLSLSQPGPDGSIPMFVQLSPGPGQCDVLVTAKQGTAVAESSLSVRIE
ncbi:MAG TPA: VWA domain-containing protein [Candidatus Binatus sp.]|nr:VWA domain-containing protein [Candidatus Binatus sp.]